MPSILITGASSGIGLACVKRFAAEGWSVIGTVRDTARTPDGWPEKATLEQLDLAEEGSAAALGQRVVASAGCPDVLLNNAGVVQWGPIETMPAEEVRRIFQVNVFGQLELVRALVPAMRERGSGVIANVTSLGGRTVFPFFGVYNATKWAMEGLSEGLWHELKPFGIRVKAIEPGYVLTPIWDKGMRDASGQVERGPEPYTEYMANMAAFERAISKRTSPEDAAAEILSAVTDDSDRLRYPVAAYAADLIRVRHAFGAQRFMRFFHKRWMGPESG